MRLRALFIAAAVLAAVDLHGQQQSGFIDVPDGMGALMQAKGDGVQVYACTRGQTGQSWVLTGPDARLFDLNGNVIGTHFAGPTWKLNDGGAVQGVRVASKSSPDRNSVDWLLLRAKEGTPTGSLGSVTFIQRTDTHGGVAKNTGCQDPSDIGKTDRVPYSATYTFYVPK